MATVEVPLEILAARVFTTVAAPELVQDNGTDEPVVTYAFDGSATIEAIYWKIPLRKFGASNSTVTLTVDFFTSATTNATVFQAAMKALTPGDAQSVLTDTFQAASAASAVTSNATTNGPKQAVITISNIDSAVDGDVISIKLFRDPANGGDTNTADAKVETVTLSYSDT